MSYLLEINKLSVHYSFLAQIETLTDNKRRTAPALRHILGKWDGSLGTNGSVSWMFELKGYLEVLVPPPEAV